LETLYKTKEFENAALFLQLGLPSTRIRLENGAFLKRSSNRRNFENVAICFRMNGNIFKTELIENDSVAVITEISFSFRQTQSKIIPVIVAFLNSYGEVWTDFQSETSVFKVWSGP